MDAVLSLDNLCLTYQTKKSETLAVDRVSLDIFKGEFISIVGPSGCGKTTILSMIAGLLKPSSGKIMLAGKQVDSPSTDIGYMLQRDNLFEWLNVYENVTLGLRINHKKNCLTTDKIKQLLAKYGLIDFIKARPGQLSGGMRQRVSLIRTLAVDPKILLLDEPFSALDYQTRVAVQNDIHSIIKSEKKTAILVTHDISEAIAMSDRIVVLSRRPGRIKKIITLEFEPSLSPLERRNIPLFNEYFKMLWGGLQ